jgi:hypothetical protein
MVRKKFEKFCYGRRKKRALSIVRNYDKPAETSSLRKAVICKVSPKQETIIFNMRSR